LDALHDKLLGIVCEFGVDVWLVKLASDFVYQPVCDAKYLRAQRFEENSPYLRYDKQFRRDLCKSKETYKRDLQTIETDFITSKSALGPFKRMYIDMYTYLYMYAYIRIYYIYIYMCMFIYIYKYIYIYMYVYIYVYIYIYMYIYMYTRIYVHYK